MTRSASAMLARLQEGVAAAAVRFSPEATSQAAAWIPGKPVWRPARRATGGAEGPPA